MLRNILRRHKDFLEARGQHKKTVTHNKVRWTDVGKKTDSYKFGADSGFICDNALCDSYHAQEHDKKLLSAQRLYCRHNMILSF
jgi:hypothetical protein